MNRNANIEVTVLIDGAEALKLTYRNSIGGFCKMMDKVYAHLGGTGPAAGNCTPLAEGWIIRGHRVALVH